MCRQLSAIVRSMIVRLLKNARAAFITLAVLFAMSMLWANVADRAAQQSNIENALTDAAADAKYAEVYRKVSRLPNDTKYLLLWTRKDYAPFYYLGRGQRAFIQRNCSVYNCYVTDDKHLFGGDLTKFHAIAFNGRNLNRTRNGLPKHRAAHQKYIFFNIESADNYPVCSDIYDNFFNWTSTYRLDSQIPFTYIKIKDSSGRVVGPSKHMKWRTDMVVDHDMSSKLKNKSKTAAWFVSHCKCRSRREKFVIQLQKELAMYNLNIDVYGLCGSHLCPLESKHTCNNLLEEEYLFYMALENSFAEDYVTEKLLTALQHNVVPVVYGGADYSRFLPPNSYLDGRALSPSALASTMARLARSPQLYMEYFKWKSYYTYHSPVAAENVCAVCEALNNKQMYEETSVYDDFRKWWHPDYAKRCSTV